MKIGVLGAGAIGTYVGAKLVLAGHDVVLVGRLKDEVAAHGIELTDHAGHRARLEPGDFNYVDDPLALADRDVVFVAVKSMATEEATAPLVGILKPGTRVASLQNGVSNAQRLRAVLPEQEVLAGMVPFNVARPGPGCFHNGTDGPLAIESRGGAERDVVSALEKAGFEVEARADVVSLQWSKLLVNLNNAVNALAGVPLKEQLASRDYRLVMAACVREGLAVTRAAGIRLVRVGKLIPSLAPVVLSLPTFLFLAAARAMVKVDPQAKSSMLDDLERGRVTEVDYLNGEIVRLGETHRVPTPVNRKIVSLIREAETTKLGSPRIGAPQLRAALERG
jgi:2-dehydropantoate 2-reductase